MSNELHSQAPGMWRLGDDVPRFAMSTLPSKATVCPAHTRTDPFWSGMWSVGSTGHWDSSALLRQRLATGGDTKVRLSATRDEAGAKWVAGGAFARRMRLLSVVDMWRTVSAEQAACMAGEESLLNPASAVVHRSFDAGLIDVGTWKSPMAKPARGDWLYRPATGDAFASVVEPHLSYPQWVSVTAGMGWGGGGQYDRHNLLTNEVCLRAAEWCDVGTILGEKLSTCALLAQPAQLGKWDRMKTADATIIRRDGLRIAVELTASHATSLEVKLERWAEAMANASFRDSGLVVLVVVAEPLNKERSSLHLIAKLLRRVAARYPGPTGQRVADRMFMVDWREWFPAPGQVSARFATLTARRPNGPTGTDRAWELVDLLGPAGLPFAPRSIERATAVLHNAHGLAGVPTWLRDPARAPQWWRVPLVPLGWDGNLPMPRASRPFSVPDNYLPF